MDVFKNFAKGTVDGLYDDEATGVDLVAGDGARFPAAPFNAVWWNATDYPDPSDDPNREVIRVTAINTDALSVTRGLEGTGAGGAGSVHNIEGKTHKLIAGLTAKSLNDDIPIQKSGDDFTFNTKAGSFLFGDPEAFGNGNFGSLNNGSGIFDLLMGTRIALQSPEVLVSGRLLTNQSSSATVGVGAIARKLEVFDENGDSLGFIPIYSSIT